MNMGTESLDTQTNAKVFNLKMSTNANWVKRQKET